MSPFLTIMRKRCACTGYRKLANPKITIFIPFPINYRPIPLKTVAVCGKCTWYRNPIPFNENLRRYLYNYNEKFHPVL